MRSRWLVIGGAVGTALGAAVAYIGATRVFICHEPASFDAMCAGGFPILALAWGASIGLVVGVLTGAVISRRLSSN